MCRRITSPMPSGFRNSRGASASAHTSDLLARAKSGERAALSRIISLIENQVVDPSTLIPALYAKPPNAQVIGITGPPGAGKSTFVGALLRKYLAKGQKVAVIAVDPSSPITRGAVLGDRIRMVGAGSHEGAFIRSVAARGHLGGTSGRTGVVIDLLDAVGYDCVIVETVGVGQSEVAIATLAQTTVVLLAPGLGDDIQSMKSGVLEVADLFVVNKSDLVGADVLANHLLDIPPLSGRSSPVDVIKCCSTRDEGIDEVIAILKLLHERGSAGTSGRVARLKALVRDTALARLSARLDAAAPKIEQYAGRIVAGDLKLDSGIEMLLHDLTSPLD